MYPLQLLEQDENTKDDRAPLLKSWKTLFSIASGIKYYGFSHVRNLLA